MSRNITDEAEGQRNLIHGFELLRQIAVGLGPHSKTSIANIQVTFSDKAERNCFVFPLRFALDAIARDLYWDETGNWSECDTATVETF